MSLSYFYLVMKYLLPLLFAASSPAFANTSAVTSANPTQQNDNTAASQSMANQQNHSRSESIGGNLNNYQINNSMGELGIMSITNGGVSCESPSLFVNAGVIPTDAYGFYTYENNRREMLYSPQINVGVQVPFGPQVAACIETMKDYSTQVKVSTQSGTIKKCLEVKVLAKQAEVEIVQIANDYPFLADSCKTLWKL